MKLIENAKSLVILIIVAILVAGFGYYKFFYMPDKLKTAVRDHSTAISTVQKSNDKLKESIEMKDQAAILDELVVTEGEKIKKELEEKGYVDKIKVDQKVEILKHEFGKKIQDSTEPEKTAALVKARQVAISKERIDSLWVSFCRSEPNDPDCRSYK